ncbi:MAG: ABC transporter transmembrane domain-containing protein [Actinomycetota bacterium]
MSALDRTARVTEATAAQPDGARNVLRRGLRESPELRSGALYTLALAIFEALGAVLLPVLIQQIIDKGTSTSGGFRLDFVYVACGVAAIASGFVYVAGRASFRRLVRASEEALCGLRVRAFAHIHSLSLADQTAERRGVYVSRVTADIDTLTRFMEWSAISWITGTMLILGTLTVMFGYSWRLALIVLFVVAPLTVVLRAIQRGSP